MIGIQGLMLHTMPVRKLLEVDQDQAYQISPLQNIVITMGQKDHLVYMVIHLLPLRLLLGIEIWEWAT
jgi:hypothetical protein